MKNTIFEYFKNLFYPKLYANAKKPQTTPLNTNIDRNIGYLQGKFNGSADFTIRRLNINNIRGAILTMEGMCNKDTLTLSVINPLLEKEYPEIQGPELFNYIERNVLTASELTKIEDFETLMQLLMSGFAILLIDTCSTAMSIGVQGFSFRSVSEPESETSERGSREGFVEPLRINMSLLRRRLKNPDLRFETMTVGSVSKTDICMCYLTDAVSQSILKKA